MAEKVLLCSPDFIRMNSNISDNTNSKVLATAIRETQQFELQEIIGQLMIEKLCKLVQDNTIDEADNKVYKDLLDEVQSFIMYTSIAKILLMLAFKIDNFGVGQARDENLDYSSMEDILTLKGNYEKKASHYAYLLQNYCMEHRAELPELTEHQCWKIQSTLYSAATPSVFLGGARGKGYWRCWPYRYQRGMNWPNPQNN